MLVCNSCKLQTTFCQVKLRHTSSPFFLQNTLKSIAEMKGTRNNEAASFSLIMTSKKSRSLLLCCHYPLIVCLTARFRSEKTKHGGRKFDTPFITV